jgi:flagellar protein FliS
VSHAQRYAQAQAETASRERLLVLLLEAAMRQMRAGAAAFESGDVAAANRSLARAGDIVVELRGTLRRSVAPELCDRLGDVYAFVCQRLLDGSARRQPAAVREAERALAPIASAFAEAVASLGAPR